MFRNQLEKENWQQLGGCWESDCCHKEAVWNSVGLSACFVKCTNITNYKDFKIWICMYIYVLNIPYTCSMYVIE